MISFMEQTQARLMKVSALVDLLTDNTERLIPATGPYKVELDAIATNLSTVYDLLFDINTDLDKAITDAYRKTPRG